MCRGLPSTDTSTWRMDISLVIPVMISGRNNSNISGSQQDYLYGKSGSPQIYVVVIWPRFKQNNTINTILEKYSHILWEFIGLLLSSSLVV